MTTPLDQFALPEALDIQGSRLLETFNLMDEGVMIINDQGRIVYYNRFHGVIDGLEPAQVLGKKVTEVYRLQTSESLVLQCLATGQACVEIPMSYEPRAGMKVNTMVNAYPIMDNDRVTGCISFLKDHKVLREKKTVPAPNLKKPFTKKTRYTFTEIMGESRVLELVLNTARKAAASHSSVMLCGETGTGKEMFAQAIHNAGPRREHPYVAINCAAIPETLFEGLLFGTRKGAFTGAMDQKGLFEQANGGTLFLDEIDSMPLALQTKMLRAIQEKRIRRVGELEEIPIDIRIISSTSTPPQGILDDTKRFRKDLFYRLAVVLIKIPPLREREDDVSLLTKYFIERFNRRMDKYIISVSREVLALFYNYDWPGNVRELGHVIEGAMNHTERERVLDISHVAHYFKTVAPLFLDSQNRRITLYDAPPETPRKPAPPIFPIQEEPVPEDDEGDRIRRVLTKTRGKLKPAAEELGISRQLLHYRMKKHHINRKAIADHHESEQILDALAACGNNLTRTAKYLGISLQLLNYRMKKYGITPVKL
ncbi:MAG: sigma 54-interacting transcriptional regulator [Desulfobacterales bacterium]|nr:sigma 54-interacting transcriptional regulator [Desulfobacterales bacterium]